MIAYILAVIVLVITVLISLAVAFGNSMSDAPTVQGTRIWPIMLIGCIAAAMIAASHFVHWTW